MSTQTFPAAEARPADVNFTDPITHQPRSGIRRLSYKAVLNCLGARMAAELLAEGKSLQKVRNYRTAVNGWLRSLDPTKESTVGEEMGAEFFSRLGDHLAALEAEGKVKQ